MKTLKSFGAMVKASLKMFIRNKGTIVFSLLLPMVMLSVFGFLSGNSGPSIRIALTNHSTTEMAVEFEKQLVQVGAFSIETLSEEEASTELGKGHIDLHIIVPENFGVMEEGKPVAEQIETRYNNGKPQGAQIANLVISQIVDKLDRKFTGTAPMLEVKTAGVTVNNLNYFDFVLPGILAMTVMQLGIFSVAFSFVAWKLNGALRRIQATPIHPFQFVLAQAVVRLIVVITTAVVLVGFGAWFFDFHMLGSYVEFALVCIIGALIFLGIGFSIAGWAREETQVAPVANLVQLPMLLLSGIFFPSDVFPSWLQSITDVFPLTYVVDAMRKIANEGTSLWQMPGDLLGMGVWMAITYTIAVKLFRWE
ncbi:MAG TPA: ABC transporter permease [Cyclobacteriaceae bacterium]